MVSLRTEEIACFGVRFRVEGPELIPPELERNEVRQIDEKTHGRQNLTSAQAAAFCASSQY